MRVLRSVPGVGETCDECGESGVDVLLSVQKVGHPPVNICRGCLEMGADWVAQAERVRAAGKG
jgi:hypothetical protein